MLMQLKIVFFLYETNNFIFYKNSFVIYMSVYEFLTFSFFFFFFSFSTKYVNSNTSLDGVIIAHNTPTHSRRPHPHHVHPHPSSHHVHPHPSPHHVHPHPSPHHVHPHPSSHHVHPHPSSHHVHPHPSPHHVHPHPSPHHVHPHPSSHHVQPAHVGCGAAECAAAAQHLVAMAHILMALMRAGKDEQNRVVMWFARLAEANADMRKEFVYSFSHAFSHTM